MNIDVSEWICLNDHGECTAQHLADVSGLSHDEIDELIESGVIVPVDKLAEPRSFKLHFIVIANLARRLRDDFELDLHGLVLALTLIRRIDVLEADLSAMRTWHDHASRIPDELAHGREL